MFAGSSFADSREAQLEAVRGRIERLQRELNETVGKRDSAREALQQHEQRIDDTIRALRETEAQLGKESRALAELRRRERREREIRRAHLAALEAQIRASFALGQQPQLKVLLNQKSPASAARALSYYRYFNEARMARIDEAQAKLTRLNELEDQIRARSRALAALRARQAHEQEALLESRRHRAELLAKLDSRVADQSGAIERLQADEQRLERLVRELKKVIPETNAPFPQSNERFATLKGRLPLPFVGRITARFGEPKGIGELTWRGVFLSGREGQEVKAVARGRVVFADWLRGFGLLLILDHGDGYMTLYGHNQALHRHTGDWVDAGQTIAAAGNTGDAPAMGVYFEVRHNSVPHDPLQWCALGRPAPRRARR